MLTVVVGMMVDDVDDDVEVDYDDEVDYDEGGGGGDESDGSLWSFCLCGNQFFPAERSLWYVPTDSKVINQTKYLNHDGDHADLFL